MMFELSRKIINRLVRIATFRKGIYGNIGYGNTYKKNVFIHEMSTVGNYNYFGNDVMVTNAKIGNYCSIAPGVKIGQAEHSISYITTCNKITKKNIKFDMFPKQTKIENDVWIGGNAIILQGVSIGNGAVIGAGAVVNKDIPDYAIAVGVPAKIVKYRFNEEKIHRLIESEWWLNDFEKATQIVKELERSVL